MLNFDEFKEYVQLNLADALPPGYENAKLTINEVVKNNDRHLTAITVLPEGQNVAPNIYLDGFYMEYQSGTDLDTIMEEMADMAVAHMNPAPEFENIAKDFQDFDFVKERVIMVAVGRERNEELLSDVPHQNREDLALIYKVLVNSDKEGIGSITIHNNHLNFWDVSVEELHELAVENTERLLPARVQSMSEVMREIFAKDGMDEDMLEMLCEERAADEQMYVISNDCKVNGAAAIFYEEVLSNLAEKVGSDLFILPSSIHECIAVSTNSFTAEGLAEMVVDVNASQVAPEERLSDHVYHFDAAARTIKLADTTVEALGLVAADSSHNYEATQTNTEGNRPRHHR